MGLIKAGIGALGGTLADQWKEFFYCDALPADVLVRKGQKRRGNRSSNTKGDDNIISDGSGIVVADGQCMLIVAQGQIVEFCAEPGEFTYDTSTEPSLFTGKFSEAVKETLKTVGRRFTYGGDTGKDQRVYYINTKEIMGNRFGTPSPILFDVVNARIGMSRTVQVRCNGVYSYTVSDPVLFYSKVCGNVSYEFCRDEIDEQLKTEFISALQPALGELSALGLRPAQLPAKVNELKDAMNRALQTEWAENRGLSIGRIALNPITLTEEDMKKINQMEDAATYGSNAFMMAGRMTEATATAMEKAAENEAGAMTGFMGMGMATQNGAMNTVGQLYREGVAQEQARNATAPKTEEGWKCTCGAVNKGKFCAECGAKKPEEGWKCACGAVNKGKFCTDCGAKKPAGEPLYRCDKCGWEPEDPKSPPRFCPECGDPFGEEDAR
ncbi:MAG: SPFH domain-containing protein [Clostridia bacterium]|nr:SPFH domain-containing protein [Clostridia bacterium]